MFTAKQVSVDHKDLIHDVSYDFYGKRMATCSSDQSVKVFDLHEDGQWQCTATWKCHSGSVWKVSWAHPEFGQVLATCSFDRTVAIWEEQVTEKKSPLATSSDTHWVKRASLVDSRTEVNDVKFAPRNLGLQLATCSTDGQLRIYEAPDVMNLSQWSLMFALSCKPGTSCLSWNPSRIHPPMIVVGTNDTGSMASSRLQIFEYSEDARKWQKIHSIVGIVFDPVHDVAFAPNLGRSYHMLAVASKDVDIIHLAPSGTDPNGCTKLDVRHPAHFDHQGAQVWRVDWNVTGTILASSGDDGCVRLWKANYLENWKCISVLRAGGGTSNPAPTNPPASHSSGGYSSGLSSSHQKDKPNNWLNEFADL
ncbi:nucleoporin SEH1-like [Halichondria panicea]|uniref:nucleoporin SEH1-like n=1 Tax=Halichondria panicea TaxID=6063 RepID=UPI00312BC071